MLIPQSTGYQVSKLNEELGEEACPSVHSTHTLTAHQVPGADEGLKTLRGGQSKAASVPCEKWGPWCHQLKGTDDFWLLTLHTNWEDKWLRDTDSMFPCVNKWIFFAAEVIPWQPVATTIPKQLLAQGEQKCLSVTSGPSNENRCQVQGLIRSSKNHCLHCLSKAACLRVRRVELHLVPWLAGEKISLPSEKMIAQGPKLPLQGWGRENKRSQKSQLDRED